jgi:bacillithiol system protein YtxJ
MNWIKLTDLAQLEQIAALSADKPQVVFKHSTRCSISSTALNRLEKGKVPDNADYYYLDLISYRNISNEIANRFGVQHESPQILVIRNGDCVYDESHLGISADELAAQV